MERIENKEFPMRNYWDKWEYLSWDQMRQLRGSSFHIGSHSRSHKPLATLSKGEMENEVCSSREELRENLRMPITIFSYPHGSLNNSLKEIVKKAGYIAACSSIIGKNDSNVDIYELRRTEIHAEDTILEFKKKLKGCYDWIAFFKGKRG